MSKVKTQKKCPKCNHYFSARGGNYEKHITKCNGDYVPFVKSVCCKHCGVSFLDNMTSSERANHTRWCDENPKRDNYVKVLAFTRSRITEEARGRNRKGIAKAHADGKYKGAVKKALETKQRNGTLRHSDETKELLRQKALKSKHRRLVRSVRKYVCKDGNVVMLDSSWELALAKRLDELNIEWLRPDPIPWIDDAGTIHNYFPDFYLPNQHLYLDPKNPQAIKVQRKKLKKLLTQYNNIVIINSLEECKNFSI